MMDVQQRLSEQGKSRLTFQLDGTPADETLRVQAIADEIKSRREKRELGAAGAKP